MKLLAFETATEACSVAVWVDGQVIERFEIAPRRHAELALPWAEQLLAEAGIARRELDAIAVGRGPGAFTGVRLAVAICQGIALALDRPVLPVSTLLALASQASGTHVLAAIDARMGEVYSAAYERNVSDHGSRLHAVTDEEVGAPEAVVLPGMPLHAPGIWQGIGTGFAADQGVLASHLQAQLQGVDAQALPHAADVARLAAAAFDRGEAIAADQLEPAYLRNNVALTTREQQALRAAKRETGSAT